MIPEHPIETKAGKVGRMCMQNQRSQKNQTRWHESWFPYRLWGSLKMHFGRKQVASPTVLIPRKRDRDVVIVPHFFLLVCVFLASHAYVFATTGLGLQSLCEGQRRERTRKGRKEEKRTFALGVVVRGARTQRQRGRDKTGRGRRKKEGEVAKQRRRRTRRRRRRRKLVVFQSLLANAAHARPDIFFKFVHLLAVHALA